MSDPCGVEDGGAHLALAIDLDSEPISGWVAVPGLPPRRFSGWIDLAEAIEEVRVSVRIDGPSGFGLRTPASPEGKTLGCSPGASAAESR